MEWQACDVGLGVLGATPEVYQGGSSPTDLLSVFLEKKLHPRQINIKVNIFVVLLLCKSKAYILH